MAEDQGMAAWSAAAWLGWKTATASGVESMANVKVTWALPVARESVRPLAPADIHHVRLEISADGGANYGVFWTFGASILEATVTDLEPGEWWFRGIVVDTASRQSQPVSSSITIADTTPPGPLTLSLSLA